MNHDSPENQFVENEDSNEKDFRTTKIEDTTTINQEEYIELSDKKEEESNIEENITIKLEDPPEVLDDILPNRRIRILKMLKNNIGIFIFLMVILLISLLCAFVAKWDLTWRGWLAYSITLLTLVALVKNFAPAELIVVASLALMVTTKVILPKEALMGFGNESIFTISILFIVSKGIENTRVLDILLRKFLGTPKRISFALIKMMLPVGLASAFMNNAVKKKTTKN